jgi:hypothetical protein
VIRLAWRQLRLPAISAGILLVILALVLVLTEHWMTSFMRTSGLAAAWPRAAIAPCPGMRSSPATAVCSPRSPR